MVRYKQTTCVLAGLALVLLAGCSGPGYNKAGGPGGHKPVVLTLANPSGTSIELDGFASQVSRLSGGTIRIDVQSRWRYNGQVASENGLIRDVRAGKADLGVVGSRAWDTVGVPTFRALDAPLLIDSYALEERVVRSRMTEEMLLGLKPLGLVGIGVLPGPLKRPLGIAHPLLKSTDYAGLRFGVTQSRLQAATVRALGAKPVWIPSGGSIAGLGGLETHVSSIEGSQYDKVAKYLTANVVLWPRPLTLFANEKAFGALSASQRRILRRASIEDVGPETNSVREAEFQDTATLCRAGRLRFVTASRGELTALRRAVEPVDVQLMSDPVTRTYLAQIKALARRVAPERAPACVDVAPPASSTSLLDGVYRFTTSAADLRAAGAQPNEVVPENYGSWTIVVDHGRFSLAQDNSRACTWAYGKLAVKGKTLEVSVIEGGGIAPTGALDKPGELWTYTWNLYRDTLTLGHVGQVSPTPTMAKPWRRIATAPSSRFFSKRCPPPPNALPR
jgi:TRAP-type C4-dicarboxylate transport system substrate-binding protein